MSSDNALTQSTQCAPAVESFTRFRKREFARRAVPSIPYTTILDQQGLFSADAYADIETLGPPRTVSQDGCETPTQEDDPDKTYMECMPISETRIQNNTCVLAPEVTEGPYYHVGGHPIRQNIAEYQDGLPLVSPSICFDSRNNLSDSFTPSF